MINIHQYLDQLSYSKLYLLEWITLNLVSIAYIILGIYESLPGWVLTLVGLSIVFLNVARGIKALKSRQNGGQALKSNKETTPPEADKPAKGG